MISWVEEKKGLNFTGKPTVKVLKREPDMPVELRLGAHGTVHMDCEAAEALLAELQAALGGAK